ncbi:hypothetical protein LR48_Vigan438s001100 [Vigna angularis]|uniref:Uncharacterized protein n=1 Tax=Phaseolus angularis TaxID=3914 RepID=A0A0L9TAC0_PHAAN|nr:hypothetical protein LR48_Vigan438s001100 [Vigna angularis]
MSAPPIPILVMASRAATILDSVPEGLPVRINTFGDLGEVVQHEIPTVLVPLRSSEEMQRLSHPLKDYPNFFCIPESNTTNIELLPPLVLCSTCNLPPSTVHYQDTLTTPPHSLGAQ